MAKELNLPKLGVNMTEAVIVEWRVKPGDKINQGDIILVAETDKSTQDVPSDMSGILAKILVQAGETQECYKPIAILTEPGESFADTQAAQAAAAPAAMHAAAQTTTAGRVKISPLAKKIARDAGIDYKKIPPSAPDKRIVKADVLKYMRSIPQGTAPVVAASVYSGENQVAKKTALTGIRGVIAQRMNESNLTKPCAALELEADVSALIAWRDSLKCAGHSVGYNEIMVLIAAAALKMHPSLNAVMSGQEIHEMQNINIGVAVDTERGLLVPVIQNAGCKSLLEISAEFRQKADNAKSGKMEPDDMNGGTFTITNLGMFGVERFTPIINPPECAILALGAIIKKPVAVDDAVQIKPMMAMTLVFDHRMVDGAAASKLLAQIKQFVLNPLDLLN